MRSDQPWANQNPHTGTLTDLNPNYIVVDLRFPASSQRTVPKGGERLTLGPNNDFAHQRRHNEPSHKTIKRISQSWRILYPQDKDANGDFGEANHEEEEDLSKVNPHKRVHNLLRLKSRDVLAAARVYLQPIESSLHDQQDHTQCDEIVLGFELSLKASGPYSQTGGSDRYEAKNGTDHNQGGSRIGVRGVNGVHDERVGLGCRGTGFDRVFNENNQLY